MAKRGLGKGLDALIPKNMETTMVENIPINNIDPNPYQPRKDFDLETMTELAESIKEHGIIQPIIIKRHGDRYELIAGERRLRASEMAGLVEVPAIIGDFSKEDAIELALIENLQREDLNPIEEAYAYQRLREEFNMTQDEIAAKIGKSRSTIANSLRLINLEDEIKDSVSRGTIDMGHARALLGLPSGDIRREAFKRVIEKSLSVRQTEELVRNISESRENVSRGTKITKIKDPNVVQVENSLRKILGTKVSVKDRKGKGKIEIEYYSLDDLDRILQLLNYDFE